MALDLEKEILEIKVCVGEIKVKLDIMAEYERRLREIESLKDKLIGITIIANVVISAAIAYIVKFLK
jgi:hypothetical protein